MGQQLAEAGSSLSSKVAPRLGDLPVGERWLAAPGAQMFDPRHPPTLFCRGRLPGLTNLAASQVAERMFITPTVDILATTTIAFTNVGSARSWFTEEVRRPGFAACVIQHLRKDQAATDPLQGVSGSLTLVRSSTPRLRVGMESYELTATFRLSTGSLWNHVWAVARYGRVVFVLQGSWFSDGYGSAINPLPLLKKAVKRTPPR
jgi:hypothetical protein